MLARENTKRVYTIERNSKMNRTDVLNSLAEWQAIHIRRGVKHKKNLSSISQKND